MDTIEEQLHQRNEVMVETVEYTSKFIDRSVQIDIYRAGDQRLSPAELLLINDGQDLVTMDFADIVWRSHALHPLKPLLIAGIHSGEDRKNEYGMSSGPDFKGWGAKAAAYEQFITGELIPLLYSRFHEPPVGKTGFAGFSLGALSALDIAWNNPDIFSKAGVFSGSLWWRTVEKEDKHYDPWKHRMMHRQIANTALRPAMQFFFECGEHDEEEDRNRNGVIDSIDDTIDVMRLLIKKGYREGKDFRYLQLPEGRHDITSWAKALPEFLQWGYGNARPILLLNTA